MEQVLLDLPLSLGFEVELSTELRHGGPWREVDEEVGALARDEGQRDEFPPFGVEHGVADEAHDEVGRDHDDKLVEGLIELLHGARKDPGALDEAKEQQALHNEYDYRHSLVEVERDNNCHRVEEPPVKTKGYVHKRSGPAQLSAVCERLNQTAKLYGDLRVVVLQTVLCLVQLQLVLKLPVTESSRLVLFLLSWSRLFWTFPFML